MGDYSDRSGDATHILRELVEQNVAGVLYAPLRDERVIESLVESGASVGDVFSMDVGGFAGPASGTPVRITGRIAYVGPWNVHDTVAAIEYGDRNMLIITPALVQVTEPESLAFGPIQPDDYQVIVVKSRVHFRRGFDEAGFAQTIIVVDAPAPYVGTIALDALDYEFAPIEELYPFGMPGR